MLRWFLAQKTQHPIFRHRHDFSDVLVHYVRTPTVRDSFFRDSGPVYISDCP